MGNTRYEINLIISDLENVINELYDIASGLRNSNNFENIGNVECTESLEKIAEQYRYVIRKMHAIDESKLAEGYSQEV